jgi:hypothetical protein
MCAVGGSDGANRAGAMSVLAHPKWPAAGGWQAETVAVSWWGASLRMADVNQVMWNWAITGRGVALPVQCEARRRKRSARCCSS